MMLTAFNIPQVQVCRYDSIGYILDLISVHYILTRQTCAGL